MQFLLDGHKLLRQRLDDGSQYPVAQSTLMLHCLLQLFVRGVTMNATLSEDEHDCQPLHESIDCGVFSYRQNGFPEHFPGS